MIYHTFTHNIDELNFQYTGHFFKCALLMKIDIFSQKKSRNKMLAFIQKYPCFSSNILKFFSSSHSHYIFLSTHLVPVE